MSEQYLGSVLRRLQIDQSTGSLVCVGEDNNFARVYLVDGMPKAARCRDLQGKEALRQLSAAPLASIKFHDGVNLIKTDEEDEDLDDFVLDDAASVTAAVDSGSGAALDFVVETLDRTLRNTRLTADQRDVVAEELVEYVGPIAAMVTGGLEDDISLGEALKVVVYEIGDPQQAAEFVDRVRQRL